MAVSTSRTARYGGAAATFSTAASPGGAISALFTVVDAALTGAGWTRLVNAGSPGPNYYSSPGESGNDHLFLSLSTGAYGTASGVDVSGGSYLVVQTLQWANSSSAFCNALGCVRLSSSVGQPSQSLNALSLTASITWDYALVVDLDGLALIATDHAAGSPFSATRYLLAGMAQRAPNTKATLITSANLSNGTQVSVNVTANPITAGYLPGDAVYIIGQQAGAGVATLGDIIATRIVSLTTTSVTLENVAGLSGTLSSGTLIGEDPQPYYGSALNTGASTPDNALSQVRGIVSPLAGIGLQTQNSPTGVNLWTQQINTDGTGSIDGATLTNNINACSTRYMPRIGGTLASSGTEARTNANLASQLLVFTSQVGGNNYAFLRGYTKYLLRDQRQSNSAQVSGTINRALQTTEEWVAINFNATVSCFMGPFPAVASNPTRLRKLDYANEWPVELQILPTTQEHQDSIGWSGSNAYESGTLSDVPYLTDRSDMGLSEATLLVTTGLSSSDDAQIARTDRTYPFDYTAPLPPTILSLTPAASSTILATDPISFRVFSPNGLSESIVYAKEGTGPSAKWRVVVDMATFGTDFSAASSVITNADGFTYTIIRNGGWQNANISLMVSATNAAGGSLAQVLTYTVSNPVIIFVPGHSSLNVGLN